MRLIGTKGFKVVQDKNGKATLERLPFYGRDKSAVLRGRKSKKAKVVRPSPDHLWGEGEVISNQTEASADESPEKSGKQSRIYERTNALRFLRTAVDLGDGTAEVRNVLQQMWTAKDAVGRTVSFEWRDVELEIDDGALGGANG